MTEITRFSDKTAIPALHPLEFTAQLLEQQRFVGKEKTHSETV